MPRKTVLQTIEEEFERPRKEARPVKLATLRRWMRGTHPEVRGATYCFLMEPKCVERLVPPISLDEAFDWLMKYWRWCLTKNPDGEYCDSRGTAATDMVVFFVGLWDDGEDVSYFERMRDLVAELYRTGSDEMKYDLVYAHLEHLFERRKIRKFFESWKDDPQLAKAYDDAMEWVLAGGTSPLTAYRRRKRKASK